MPHSTRQNELMIVEGRTSGTNFTGSDMVNPGYTGVLVFLNVDAIATGNITVVIEGKSPVGTDEYYTLLTSAAIAATGLTVLTVYPGGIAETANLVTDDPLPATWRVRATIAGGGTRTYDLGAVYIP